jgi:hypothetical protein
MAATFVSERILPTRFPSGVGNVAKRDTFGMLGIPDPVRYHNYTNDFERFGATEWTVTLIGTGTAALANADGGELLLTTTAGAADSVFLQKVGEGFAAVANQPMFFKARFKMSDANTCALAIGLQVTNAAFLNPTDGIYFVKQSGSTALTGVVRKDAAAGSTATGTLATIVNNTYFTIGWYYDGKSEVQFFVNDIQVGTLAGTAAFLPDTTVTPTFGITNGAAAVKTMNIDYISAIKYRGSARP